MPGHLRLVEPSAPKPDLYDLIPWNPLPAPRRTWREQLVREFRHVDWTLIALVAASGAIVGMLATVGLAFVWSFFL